MFQNYYSITLGGWIMVGELLKLKFKIMIINIETYEQGATTGSATIQVLDKYDEFIMDLTVNFEFTTDEYETGDGYITPIEDWLDVEITQTEYFNADMQRFKPKREIQDYVESALVEKIKEGL